MTKNRLQRRLNVLASLGLFVPSLAIAAPPLDPPQLVRAPVETRPPPRKAGKSAAARQKRSVTQHAAARERYLGTAVSVEQAAGPRAKSDWLHAQATAKSDPELHLDAADAALALPPSQPLLDRAAEHLNAADDLLRDPSAFQWLDDGEAQRLERIRADLGERLQQGRDAQGFLAAMKQAETTRRDAAGRRTRRGRQELVAGAAMMTASFAGVGVAFGGLAYERQYRGLLASPLYSAYDTESVELRHTYGTTMIAAGVVSAVLFAAMGIPLLVIGGRDLKLGREELGRSPRLALQPGPASFFIRLNF